VPGLGRAALRRALLRSMGGRRTSADGLHAARRTSRQHLFARSAIGLCCGRRPRPTW
jgi:hypothetical protein